MNVLLGLAKTIPSRIIPIPSLLALPSKPIETTILFYRGGGGVLTTNTDESWKHEGKKGCTI